MESGTRDWVAGGFVLVGLAAMVWMSVQLGGVGVPGPGGLRLIAYFDEIGGLSERAPVVISGVRVGRVEAITLGEDLRAKVELEIDAGVSIPVDSTAAIRTQGLLGDQLVAVEPGAEDASLRSGDAFAFADSAVLLESLIGNLVHGTDLEE